MNDRYAGDIGDYGKLGLLRQLTSTGLSIGVNWYLTQDKSHGNDGQFVDYLHNDAYRQYDPPLWDALRQIVFSGERAVHVLEESSVLDAVYYSTPLAYSSQARAERLNQRRQWHDDAVHHLKDCELIFADPDIGLLVPSADGTVRDVHYAYPEELLAYYHMGKSVIYYQHKARLPDEFYLQQHRQLFLDNTNAKGLCIRFNRISLRYFNFIIQPQHAERIIRCIHNTVASPWGNCFSILNDAD